MPSRMGARVCSKMRGAGKLETKPAPAPPSPTSNLRRVIVLVNEVDLVIFVLPRSSIETPKRACETSRQTRSRGTTARSANLWQFERHVYQALRTPFAHYYHIPEHAADVRLPVWIENVDVVAEHHILFEHQVADVIAVHAARAKAGPIDDGGKFWRSQAVAVEAEFDKVELTLVCRCPD